MSALDWAGYVVVWLSCTICGLRFAPRIALKLSDARDFKYAPLDNTDVVIMLVLCAFWPVLFSLACVVLLLYPLFFVARWLGGVK